MTDRQKQIVTAATALFLSEGIGVPTARIASAAGVSNGTLFNCFATKQTLIDTIYLQTKAEMFAALDTAGGGAFDRDYLYRLCAAFLVWARQNPSQHRIMHLLFEAGLASDAAQRKAEILTAPYAALFHEALRTGVIRGPCVDYIVKLVLFQLDLMIAENLTAEQEAQAFDMLCHSIGLTI